MYNSKVFLFEADLSNINDLRAALDELLKNKDISSGPIYNWFMKQYIKWYTSAEEDDQKSLTSYSYKEGDPEWMKKPGMMSFSGFDDRTKNQLNHMIDYFNSLEERELASIYKEPYRVIVTKVRNWDEELASKMQKKVSDKRGRLEEGKDFKVLRTMGEFRWVHLLTKESYQCEGDDMGHCVGTYTPGTQDIISLWDKNNEPHVTISIKNKAIKEIKGKQNKAPIDKYQEATKQFIKGLVSQGYKVTGDGRNVGMINYKDQFWFPDDPEWGKIYQKEVKPLQDKAIRDINSSIKEENISVDSLLSTARNKISNLPEEFKTEISSVLDEITQELSSLKNESNNYYKNLRVLFG